MSGLVRGGAKGGSLGGEFLGHLRATDAILHVVRTFPDADVFHVDGRVDPVADAEAVDLELILADHAIVERRIERLSKAARTGDKVAAAEADVLGRLLAHLDGGQPARPFAEGVPAGVDLLTVKPLVYVANTSEEGDAEAVAALRCVRRRRRRGAGGGALRGRPGRDGRPRGARGVPGRDRQEEAGMPRVASAAFRLLELITFFTVGPKEARAWPLRRGSSAVEAAGKIHADIARGFIRAEVIRLRDMLVGQSARRGPEARRDARRGPRLRGRGRRRDQRPLQRVEQLPWADAAEAISRPGRRARRRPPSPRPGRMRRLRRRVR